MRIKSSWWLFVLFIGLSGLTWYMLINKPDKTSLILADRDFAVKDVGVIHKIFLATRNKEPITLEKIDGVWMLNGKYKAAANPIKNLLETIRDIRMQSIPSKGHVKSIMEGIAVYGIKVEIYGEDDEKLKTYYIGGTTQQEYGTYFFMEHGSQPYIMEIPHFAGNLRERFDLDETDWRDRTVFDIPTSSIEKVSVEYPYQEEQSFVIKKTNNEFSLFDFTNSNLKLQSSNATVLNKYIQGFEGIGAEDIQNVNPLRKEVVKLKPFCIISISQSGKKDPTSYRFFPIQVDTSGKVSFEFNQSMLDQGTYFRLHIDRSDGDFLLVQYPVVQAVLKKKDDLK